VRHVARLDADIVCLQEVEDEVFEALQAGLPRIRATWHARQATGRTLRNLRADEHGIMHRRAPALRRWQGAERASGHVALLVR